MQSIDTQLFASLSKEELEIKAQEGDINALYELGLKYEKGINGFPKDKEKSIVLFARAFAQGHQIAGTKVPKVMKDRPKFVEKVQNSNDDTDGPDFFN